MMDKLPQIVRFLLLGGLAAAVNWLARIVLSLALPFPTAVLVAYMIGMSAGFTLYRAYVFPRSALPVPVQIGCFLAVNAVGATVVMAVSLGLVDIVLPAAGYAFQAEAVGHGIAIGVGAVTNFLGHKHLTFWTGSQTAQATPSSPR